MADVYTVLRIIDLSLYVLVFTGMWRHRAQFWASSPGVRMERVGLAGLAIASAYATSETLLTGVPGGPRLFMLTVALTFLVGALHADLFARLKNRRDDRGR